MNRVELVKAFAVAMEANDFEQVASYLSDDFQLSGPTPQPLGKQEFVAVQSAFQRAFPDWSFNSHDEVERGNKVISTVRITGTHTQELVVPIPGMPAVPATGKKIALKEKKLEFTFKGDKITSLTTDNMPGAGVPGILAQI